MRFDVSENDVFGLADSGHQVVWCHPVCTGSERCARVVCTPAHTHSCDAFYTRTWQRERLEPREVLSVHAETALGVDCAISSMKATHRRGNNSRARSWGSVSRRRTRRIEGRSTTVTDSAAEHLCVDQTAIFLWFEMLAYVVGSLFFYTEQLCLELQMMLRPDEYKLFKFASWKETT